MIYLFHCKNCNKDIELNIKADDLPKAKCNLCQSTNINRIWSPTNSVWKTPDAYSKQNHKDN